MENNNCNLEKKTSLLQAINKFVSITYPALLFIVIIAIALLNTANASIIELQEQLDTQAAELAITQQNIEDLTKRSKMQIDELYLKLDELTNAQTITNGFNPMLLNDLTFEKACKLACSPDTPEEVLIYLATKMEYFVESKDEALKLCTLLLSNENSSIAIFLPLIKTATVEAFPLLASSKLHNELSLYLMANAIRCLDESSAGSYAYIAAVNVLNNPALSKEAVHELSLMNNKALNVLIDSNTYTKP